MKTIENAIQHLPRFSTVLVACDSDRSRSELIDLLGRRELSILGPAATAGQAMTLASHAPADLAIIDLRLADDQRGGRNLADQLSKTWGMQTLLLETPA